MNIILVFSFVYFLSAIHCYDSESKSNALWHIMLLKGLINLNESRLLLGSESNRIEVSPFYDTIIYSDIADIINDFGNDGVSIKV